MYIVDHRDQEEHYSEGEPDLEPPEELAVGELDDEVLLEEDLDSEAVLEQDVDEDVLEESLEDLVHLTDGDGEEDLAEPAGSAADLDELDVEPLDIADVEESLDRILSERLAHSDEAVDDGDDLDVAVGPEPAPRRGVGVLVEEPEVAPCRANEFVCRGCFLVRSRVQLADAPRQLCRDCST